jgi:hypothetical protein
LELEAQELEPIPNRDHTRLGIGHLESNIRKNAADKTVSGLGLPTSVGQDHEIVGVTDQPETGCPHFHIEPVKVDIGQQRRDHPALGSARL